MAIITRGFSGRGRRDVDLPPGQYLTEDFPVLSAGPTPRVPLDTWQFAVTTETGAAAHLDLGRAAGAAQRGGHGRPALRDEVVEARHRLARGVRSTRCWTTSRPRPTTRWSHSYGGYTTNLPLEDLLDGQAWIAYEYDGEPLRARARRPGPAARAAPVPVEERQVGARASQLLLRGRAGLLGERRLPQLRRPMARAAVLGRLTWQGRPRVARRSRATETPSRAHAGARRARTGRATWPGSTSTSGSPPRTATAPSALLDRLGSRPRPRWRSPCSGCPDGEVSPYLVRRARGRRPVRAARSGRRLLRLAPDEPRRCCWWPADPASCR